MWGTQVSCRCVGQRGFQGTHAVFSLNIKGKYCGYTVFP